jgi:hypothetical protein
VQQKARTTQRSLTTQATLVAAERGTSPTLPSSRIWATAIPYVWRAPRAGRGIPIRKAALARRILTRLGQLAAPAMQATSRSDQADVSDAPPMPRTMPREGEHAFAISKARRLTGRAGRVSAQAARSSTLRPAAANVRRQRSRTSTASACAKGPRSSIKSRTCASVPRTRETWATTARARFAERWTRDPVCAVNGWLLRGRRASALHDRRRLGGRV